MKYIIFTLFVLIAFSDLKAQNFNQYLTDARSSYSSKKLEDARFAMQQMLQELDVMAGKDILKLLPQKIDLLNANTVNDNVSGNSGFAGIMIHRDYGTSDKTAQIEIIGNSPLMASVNAILSLPFNSNGNQKIIKVDGYKALLQKNGGTDKVSYEIQVPLNSSLLTFTADGVTEEGIQKLVSIIPVGKLAALLQ